MNGDVEEEAPRPRPLSAGIWTLFSWLRRTDHSSSSESITSVGSDRTAVSFDFLAPFHYKNTNKPVILTPSPVTDTYKKRLLERKIRRQTDRDLTLRRKYGLYADDDLGYDAFSLPPARKIPKDSVRLRRAASESANRRVAYVPGKRRAPLPPIVTLSNSLPRNYKRKRPAPKPPVNLVNENKEKIETNKNMQMNSPVNENHATEKTLMLKCEIEKPMKQHEINKYFKLRSDKGFLKQMFDGRKRNSAIDTTHVKLLPSISELDKQAAQIIETKKSLRASGGYESNSNDILKYSDTDGSWICTICLRKYKINVRSCSYCSRGASGKKGNTSASNTCTQTETNICESNGKNNIDEKKKLREMLKEIKDSLPKRSKENKRITPSALSETETPTLRIGSTINNNSNVSDHRLNTENVISEDTKTHVNIQQAKTSFLLSQPSSSNQIVTDIVLSNLGRNKVLSNSSKVEDTPTKDNLYKNKIKKPVALNDLQKNESANKIQSRAKDVSNVMIKRNESNKDSSDDKNNSCKINFARSGLSNSFSIAQNKSKLQSVLSTIQERDANEKLSTNSKNQIESIRLGDVILSKDIKKHDINIPLKISSLLNPLYCPKNKKSEEKSSNSQIDENKFVSQERQTLDAVYKPAVVSTAVTVVAHPSTSCPKTSKDCLNIEKTNNFVKPKENILAKCNPSNLDQRVTGNELNQHAVRRDIINQLEQAISKGDEQLAAEAAAKLAKLKVSCSVLSFSSQIISEPKIPHKLLDINKNYFKKENSRNEDILEKSNVGRERTANVLEVKEASTITCNEKVIENKNKLVNCSKTVMTDCQFTNTQSPIPSTSKKIIPIPNQIIPIEVWVEDKEAARGPIRLNVAKTAIVGDLKRQAEISLGLEVRLQRWIIGRTLCSKDDMPIISLAGPDLSAPFYLCLVETETNKNNVSGDLEADGLRKNNENFKNLDEKNKMIFDDENKIFASGEVYTELIKLEKQALVPNTEPFECGVCIEHCAVGSGAVLRECIHTFCTDCLSDVVRHCEDPIVPCPAIGCPGVVQEREIRALLSPEAYEKWLARSLAAAENGTRNTFHCRTRDCTGWAFCEPGVRKFPCPVCKHTNCLPCQAVHEGETCEKYKQKLCEALTAVEGNVIDEGTQALLKSLINRGEALECPECKTLIMKKWGCDWIKCSACKTEICWVTKGRRWGPEGKGDISGGCRCGIDGKRCHPSCGYCH